MKGEVAKSIQSLIKDPASHINTLNQILPALIKNYQSDDSQQVIDEISKIIETFVEKDILSKADLKKMIMQMDIDEGLNNVAKFVIQRFNVMLANLIEETND